MSAKKLLRPGGAHTPPDIIGDLLGVRHSPDVPTRLPLSDLFVVPGFNPRTAHLSPTERDALFAPEALGELVRSMQEVLEDGEPRGVLQPLLVRPTPDGYAVIAGERRYHAARLAGLKDVPVLIRNMTEQEALAAAIIENAQRLKIDQVSEALAGFRLLGFLTGMGEEQVVRHLNAVRQGEEEDRFGLDATLRSLFGTGISTWSQQRAKVLQLLDAERLAIQRGQLNAKSVFPLLRLGENHAARLEILHELLSHDEKKSSQEVEAIVARHLQKSPVQVDRATRLKTLLPRLRKLSGPQAAEADRLIERLQALLS